MPTASDDLRDKMMKWFGSIDLGGPEQFMLSRGYTLTKDWFWIPPVPYHTISKEEFECMIFLQQEWDYGGLQIVKFIPPQTIIDLLLEPPKYNGGD